MPTPTGNPSIDAFIAQVEATNTVLDSCKAFIDGEAARITAAVTAAIGNGATAAQLQPVTDEITMLKAKSDAVAAALVANTPAAPPAPPAA